MRTVALLGLLLVLVLVWTLWSRTDDEVVPEPTRATATDPGATPASVEAATAAAPAASVEATAARTEVPAAPAPPAGPEAVLRGRCVDEHGLPIAGVQAGLTGWGANRERTDAWSKNHEEPKRIDIKIASGDDGAFEFRFWPPPPFQFALRLTKSGVASMGGRWSQLEPGATKDLGDVRMPRGTLLRGRVVDSHGAPVAKAEVHFGRPGRPSGEVAAESWDIASSKAGTFVGRWSLVAGEYAVDVPHRTVVSPKNVTIAGDQAEQFVDVVLEAIDDSKAVAGIVVDEQGKPVQGVHVQTMPPVSGRGWMITTDKEGRFRVPKPEQGATEAVALLLDSSRHEQLTTTETFQWGRTDVRLTLQRAIDVALSVVDAEGAPVEDYQVRIFPQPGATQMMMSSRDYEVRTKGPHEGGRATVKGIRRGRHFVVVEPKGEEIAMSPLVPIEVADPGPTAVTVTLARNVHRELRVQRADGTPVAGAKVQLADPLVEMPRARLVPPELAAMTGMRTPRRQVVPLDRWGFSFGNSDQALELQTATTDAKGSARLHGPGDRALAVFLPGPGHVPTVVDDVRLGEVEPLVVTIASGAGLTGVLRPVAAIAEIRQGAGLPPTGPVDASSRHHVPRIELQRGSGMTSETFPDAQQPVSVADDGTFTITGIPAGTWQVRLNWWHQNGQFMGGQSENLATVTLQEGEPRPMEFDVAHLLPGVLDGIVLQNGSALASSAVTVTVSRGKDAQGLENANVAQVTTDAEGRFQLRTRAGECRVSLQRQQHDLWSSLRAPESVHVVTGQTAAQTFHVRSGTVRVRLLDAQGRPVAQVPIELRDSAGQHRQNLPATDADGRTTGELEVDALTAAVLPKHLQDPKAQMEAYRSNVGNPDPFAAARLQCGTVQAQMGATTEVELRLAVEWPR